MYVYAVSHLRRINANEVHSGALGQAFTSDRFGRRGSITIWSVIFTIGVAIKTAMTYFLAQITIGRFIAGLGVGALSGSYCSMSKGVVANN